MNRLKELRETNGKNMAQVARDLEIPYTTYVGYEKGEREPNSETLIAFANYYNVTVDYVIGRESVVDTEEYLIACRSKDGKRGVHRLTKEEYNSAKAFIQTLRKNTNENL